MKDGIKKRIEGIEKRIEEGIEERIEERIREGTEDWIEEGLQTEIHPLALRSAIKKMLISNSPD